MNYLRWLKPSAVTDLAQLITSIRPAVRTQVIGTPGDYVQRFAWQLGCFASCDSDGFAVFSRSKILSCRILSLDRKQGNHTYALGRLLGYPHCCCRAAANVGEQELDAWARELASRPFMALFKAIDPSRYQEGKSLISHIPCSANCRPSRSMALALKARLLVKPTSLPRIAGDIVRMVRQNLESHLPE